MDKGYIILMSPCAEKDGPIWDGGDYVIQDGIYVLLPELHDCYTINSCDIPIKDIDSYVKNAKYVLHMGSPSWMNEVFWPFWKACIKYSKHIAFLGIGLTVPYHGDFQYGREEVEELIKADIIDLIVCRDKFCHYWLHQRLHFPGNKIFVLPCPGFYIFPPKIVAGKKKVVFSIVSTVTTSKASKTTFRRYYEKSHYLLDELKKRGVDVYVSYQRHLHSYPFELQYPRMFPEYPIHWFKNLKEFTDFHKDKHIYIGARNHGALPCSGSGMPSLLMGTDYRQFLADEIPFLSRYDIGYIEWNPKFILDWYQSVSSQSISESLLGWRKRTFSGWREILKPIIRRLE